MSRILSCCCLGSVFVLALLAGGCGAAHRAVVHEEDFSKVFPWPSGKQAVSIRVKPRTTLARTCFLFGSFEAVEVTPETTFYLVDEMGKKFAYTPSRSPIRRLAPVESMEIRWPQAKPRTEEEDGEGAAGADPAAPPADGAKPSPEKKDANPSPGKNADPAPAKPAPDAD